MKRSRSVPESISLCTTTPSSVSHDGIMIASLETAEYDAALSNAADKRSRSAGGIFNSGRKPGARVGDLQTRRVRLDQETVFEKQRIATVHFPKVLAEFNGFAIVTTGSGLKFKGNLHTVSPAVLVDITSSEKEVHPKFGTTYVAASSSLSPGQGGDTVFTDDTSFSAVLGCTSLSDRSKGELRSMAPLDRVKALSLMDPAVVGTVALRHVHERSYDRLAQVYGRQIADLLSPSQVSLLSKMLQDTPWLLTLRACFRHIASCVGRAKLPVPEISASAGYPTGRAAGVCPMAWDDMVTWLRRCEKDMNSTGGTAFEVKPEHRQAVILADSLGMVRYFPGNRAAVLGYVAKEAERICDSLRVLAGVSPRPTVPIVSDVPDDGAHSAKWSKASTASHRATPAPAPTLFQAVTGEAGSTPETDAAYDMLEIFGYDPDAADMELEGIIGMQDDTEGTFGDLCDEQKEALRIMCTAGVSLLTAPAGTGKTHTLGKLLVGVKAFGGATRAKGVSVIHSVLVACATGQAAKNAADKSKLHACTIHSLLHAVWTYVAVIVSGGEPDVTIGQAARSFLSSGPPDLNAGIKAFVRSLDPVLDWEILGWKAHEKARVGIMGRLEGDKKERWQHAERIVVDEYTLVSQTLLDQLLRVAVHVMGCKSVIFTGDPGQIGSVGYGSVSDDLLECKWISKVGLTVNHRQDPGARRLAEIAHCVYFRRPLPARDAFEGESVALYTPTPTKDDLVTSTIKALMADSAHKTRLADMRKVQFLSYFNKTVDKMNAVLAPLYSAKPGAEHMSRIRVGAKVMFTSNMNYSAYGSDHKKNGTICVVKTVEHTSSREFESKEAERKEALRIRRDVPTGSPAGKPPNVLDCMQWTSCNDVRAVQGRLHRVVFEDNTYVFETDVCLSTVVSAYAVTVTKFQGSENDSIVVWLDGKPMAGRGAASRLNPLNSKVLYSALTRARKHVTLVSSYERVLAAASNHPAPPPSYLRHLFKSSS